MKILTADITDIEPLTIVEVASKKDSIPQIVNDFEIDEKSRAHRWITWFGGESPQTSKPGRVVYKAVIDDKIVGYIAGHLTTRYNMDAEIQSFYILKGHQRNGIGKQLLNSFINWMKQQGAKSLCVGFDPANPYKSFYLKQGGKYLNEHWIIWDDVS